MGPVVWTVRLGNLDQGKSANMFGDILQHEKSPIAMDCRQDTTDFHTPSFALSRCNDRLEC